MNIFMSFRHAASFFPIKKKNSLNECDSFIDEQVVYECTTFFFQLHQLWNLFLNYYLFNSYKTKLYYCSHRLIIFVSPLRHIYQSSRVVTTSYSWHPLKEFSIVLRNIASSEKKYIYIKPKYRRPNLKSNPVSLQTHQSKQIILCGCS